MDIMNGMKWNNKMNSNPSWWMSIAYITF